MSCRLDIWGVYGEDTLSNFREFGNLVETLEDMGIKEDLEGREIFLFTDITISESIVANGSSTSDVLYGLVVRVFKLEILYLCSMQFVHIAGTRISWQGMDGLYIGDMF